MNNDCSNNGMGFFSALTLLFIGLKLTGYINWSWLWVLSPFIGSFCVLLILGVIVAIGNDI
jgi:hypothetical protein